MKLIDADKLKAKLQANLDEYMKLFRETDGEDNVQMALYINIMTGLMLAIHNIENANVFERGWIPISEELPDCDCFVYEANSGRVLFSYDDEYDAADWDVTHWIPRPNK